VKTAEFRVESIRRLAAAGLPTNPRLPFLEAALEPRPQDEVVSRALALHGVVAAAYGYPRDRALQWIRREELWEQLTAEEQRFLEVQTEEPKAIRLGVEALGALGWALSVIPSCEPFQKLPPTLVKKFPDLLRGEGTGQFREASRLREQLELLGMLDLLYCAHWAVRHGELGGPTLRSIQPLPAIVERRRALEWLLTRTGWDDVPLDT